jgi:elongation factor 1-gamma
LIDGHQAFDVAPDYESYEFKQLDWNKPEDRKLVEEAWKWEGTFNGKPFADGVGFRA